MPKLLFLLLLVSCAPSAPVDEPVDLSGWVLSCVQEDRPGTALSQTGEEYYRGAYGWYDKDRNAASLPLTNALEGLYQEKCGDD